MIDEIRLDNRDPFQLRVSVLSGLKWRQQVFRKPVDLCGVLEAINEDIVKEWEEVRYSDLSTVRAMEESA